MANFQPTMRKFITLIVLMGLINLMACSDSKDAEIQPFQPPSLASYQDPGTASWEVVPPEELVEVCGLDPDILAAIDAVNTYSYAIVRYGKLCHEFYHPDNPGRDEMAQNFSATKTLGATAVGRAAFMSADLPQPLTDKDRMDSWIDDITFSPDAQVAHVLAMVAFNESLAFGQKVFRYDAFGTREINRLSDVIEAVIAQDPNQFDGATTTGEFAQKEIFNKLGMSTSRWEGEIFAATWSSNLRDMARLGLLLIHNGIWGQRRLLSEEWVYKMTHPSFEDANTGYGYLTWVTANQNYTLPGFDNKLQRPLGSCQPYALWPEYPHPPSDSTECNYDGAASCIQAFDVGTFAAAGLGGQLIVGHRGLDLVIVTRNAGNRAFISTPWKLIRSALIAHDPVYRGDEVAFCEAYSSGDYAPDLVPSQ